MNQDGGEMMAVLNRKRPKTLRHQAKEWECVLWHFDRDTKYMRLPFVPFVGLMLKGIGPAGKAMQVDQVTWIADSQLFALKVTGMWMGLPSDEEFLKAGWNE